RPVRSGPTAHAPWGVRCGAPAGTLVLRRFGNRMLVIAVHLVQHGARKSPGFCGEGVELTVAGGNWARAAQVRTQAETQPITLHVSPNVAQRVAVPPLEDDAGFVLLDPATPLQRVLVQRLQRRGGAALTQSPPRVLAHRLALGLRGLGPRLAAT